jgi:hypothetical protein
MASFKNSKRKRVEVHISIRNRPIKIEALFPDIKI